MLKNDTIKLAGHVVIRVLDAKTGRELRRISTKNLVTSLAKNVMAALLCNDNTIRHQLWGIGSGNSNTAPTVGDTVLLGAKQFKKKYTSRTFTEAGVVTLQTTYTMTEGNVLSEGEDFTESALFTRGDTAWTTIPIGASANMTMISRQLHAPVHKDISNLLQIIWTFQIMTS
jgi:hypothetical protein